MEDEDGGWRMKDEVSSGLEDEVGLGDGRFEAWHRGGINEGVKMALAIWEMEPVGERVSLCGDVYVCVCVCRLVVMWCVRADGLVLLICIFRCF